MQELLIFKCTATDLSGKNCIRPFGHLTLQTILADDTVKEIGWYVAMAESIQFSTFVISEHLSRSVLCTCVQIWSVVLLCTYFYAVYFTCTELFVL